MVIVVGVVLGCVAVWAGAARYDDAKRQRWLWEIARHNLRAAKELRIRLERNVAINNRARDKAARSGDERRMEVLAQSHQNLRQQIVKVNEMIRQLETA